MTRKKPSLAARARAKGFEPETPEGGRAMMQSLTMADIAGMKPRERGLEPGTAVVVTIRLVGGIQTIKGVVAWDNGRGKVDVAITFGGQRRILHAQKSSGGSSNKTVNQLSGSPLPLVGESSPAPCPCPFPHGIQRHDVRVQEKK